MKNQYIGEDYLKGGLQQFAELRGKLGETRWDSVFFFCGGGGG